MTTTQKYLSQAAVSPTISKAQKLLQGLNSLRQFDVENVTWLQTALAQSLQLYEECQDKVLQLKALNDPAQSEVLVETRRSLAVVSEVAQLQLQVLTQYSRRRMELITSSLIDNTPYNIQNLSEAEAKYAEAARKTVNRYKQTVGWAPTVLNKLSRCVRIKQPQEVFVDVQGRVQNVETGDIVYCDVADAAGLVQQGAAEYVDNE